jgi:hypothetical protein
MAADEVLGLLLGNKVLGRQEFIAALGCRYCIH